MAKAVRRTVTRAGKRSAAQEEYKKFIGRKILFMIFLLFLIILLLGVIVTLGPLDISILEVYSAIIHKFFSDYFVVDELTSIVIWNIRLPRVLWGIMAGIGLGISGCVMQAVLKNPLASPFTLGISSGAGFGVSLAIVLNLGVIGGAYIVIGNAFVFALLCSFFIIGLSAIKGATSETLILAGIAINYFFIAMSQLFKYFATDQQLREMAFWGMGDLGRFSWHQFSYVSVAFIICIPLLMLKAWDLNVMTVGDETAKSLGVNAEHTRMFIMTVSSLLIATIVCFTGTIGFIGLVAPHMARMIIGADHRFLIPASGVLGAVVLVGADGVAMNIISPVIIPVGVVTSLVGVPFFIYLIMRRKRREFWS